MGHVKVSDFPLNENVIVDLETGTVISDNSILLPAKYLPDSLDDLRALTLAVRTYGKQLYVSD